jgi:hypothetical protein
MLPFILAAIGGYLIGDSIKPQKFEAGGLIAPNGKPTNLTPEQYKLVRTPKFKAWFGDWENSPETSSKVVDENGEPLVLYHGTDVKFNEFDLSKIGEGSDLLGKGIYLTENKAVANFYANFVGKKRYIKGYEEGIFGTLNPIYESDASEKAKKHEVVYVFFVNAKNKISINEMNVDENIKEIFIKSQLYLFEDEDKAKEIVNSRIDFANENSNRIRDYRGIIIYLIGQFSEAKNEVLNYIKNKYDCILFQPTTEFESDFKNYNNYVVFNSNQVKLADGTNTTFNIGNPDIRYKEGGEVKSNFKKWFGNSKVVDKKGKPKKMYHGTRQEFTEFKRGVNKNTHHSSASLGFFFGDYRIAQMFAYPYWGDDDGSKIKQDYYRSRRKELKIKELERDLAQTSGFNYNKYKSINSAIIAKEGRIDNEWGKITNWVKRLDYGTGANLMPVYLSIQNPFDMTFRQILDLQSNEKSDNLRKKLIKEGFDGIRILPSEDSSESEFEQYVAFYPTQIKSTISNTTFDSGNPDIRYKDGGSVNNYVYHGTGAGQALRIQKDGFIKPNRTGEEKPSISFTNDFDYAMYYAKSKGGANGKILRTLLTDNFKLSPRISNNKGDEYVTFNPVSSLNLEIMANDGTWHLLDRWDVVFNEPLN